MRVTNRINQALGRGADERQINQIRQIVIHHSANTTNLANINSTSFENGWRNNASMGAPNARGGYHEVVLHNGDVEINMQDRRRTWGAGDGSRFDLWHICLVGQHSGDINNITQKQLNNLATRIADAMSRFGISDVNQIVRHRDIPGQNTECNNVNINNVRSAVSELLSAKQIIVNTNLATNLASSQGQLVQSTTMRTGASADHAAVRKLARGTMFRSLGRSGSWTRIRLGNNEEGFVRTRMTRRAANRNLRGNEGQTTRKVNFRSSAKNGNSNVIRALQTGQMLQVRSSGHVGEFLRVRVGRVTGFVRRNSVRK